MGVVRHCSCSKLESALSNKRGTTHLRGCLRVTVTPYNLPYLAAFSSAEEKASTLPKRWEGDEPTFHY
jgi:hypothetical protein